MLHHRGPRLPALSMNGGDSVPREPRRASGPMRDYTVPKPEVQKIQNEQSFLVPPAEVREGKTGAEQSPPCLHTLHILSKSSKGPFMSSPTPYPLQILESADSPPGHQRQHQQRYTRVSPKGEEGKPDTCEDFSLTTYFGAFGQPLAPGPSGR